jgi:hypothetical protein
MLNKEISDFIATQGCNFSIYNNIILENVCDNQQACMTHDSCYHTESDTLQALTNVWWQNIGKNIRCSETKFGQLFCTKHGRIIVHVFTIVLHKTQNHNRANILCKNLHTVFGLCFCTKQRNILLVLAMKVIFSMFCRCFICKHK